MSKQKKGKQNAKTSSNRKKNIRVQKTKSKRIPRSPKRSKKKPIKKGSARKTSRRKDNEKVERESHWRNKKLGASYSVRTIFSKGTTTLKPGQRFKISKKIKSFDPALDPTQENFDKLTIEIGKFYGLRKKKPKPIKVYTKFRCIRRNNVFWLSHMRRIVSDLTELRDTLAIIEFELESSPDYKGGKIEGYEAEKTVKEYTQNAKILERNIAKIRRKKYLEQKKRKAHSLRHRKQ